MSWILKSLSGNVPSTAMWTRYSIISAGFTDSSWTVTSTALTGLSKNIGLVFGDYGRYRPEAGIEYNGALIVIGTITRSIVVQSAISLPHQGPKTLIVASTFTAPAWTATSTALTGLSKNIGLVFGSWGGYKAPVYIRMATLAFSFIYHGESDPEFTMQTAPQMKFDVDMETLLSFDLTSIPEVWRYTGSTELVIALVETNLKFRVDGKTELVIDANGGMSFVINGHTQVDFYGQGGQMPECVQGGGFIVSSAGGSGGSAENFVF